MNYNEIQSCSDIIRKHEQKETTMKYDEIQVCTDINLLKQQFELSKTEFENNKNNMDRLTKGIKAKEKEITEAKAQLRELDKNYYIYSPIFETLGVRIAELYVIPSRYPKS